MKTQTKKMHSEKKKYTFSVFSPILGKTFTNYEYFESESDFRLYACALFGGRWKLLSVEA